MFTTTLDYISAALIAAGLIACWWWVRKQVKLYKEDQRVRTESDGG